MRLLLALAFFLSCSSLASDATVGDFGTNQQAETITTTTETTVNQEGMPVIPIRHLHCYIRVRRTDVTNRN